MGTYWRAENWDLKWISGIRNYEIVIRPDERVMYKSLEKKFATRARGKDFKVLNTAKDRLRKEGDLFVHCRSDDTRIATINDENILTVECDPEINRNARALERAIGGWSSVSRPYKYRRHKYKSRLAFRSVSNKHEIESYPIHSGTTVDLKTRRVTHEPDEVIGEDSQFRKELKAYLAEVEKVMTVLWKVNKEEIKKTTWEARHSISGLEDFALSEENLGTFAEAAMNEGYKRCIKPWASSVYLYPGQTRFGVTNTSNKAKHIDIPDHLFDAQYEQQAIRLGRRRLREKLLMENGKFMEVKEKK